VFLWCGLIAFSQSEKKQSVAVVVRAYPDKIELRYFAVSASLFRLANTVGYIIERTESNAVSGFDKLQFTAIDGSPFKRWDDAKWETEMSKRSKADSNEIKMAGLAMAFTETSSTKTASDPLEKGLQSLMEKGIKMTINSPLP